MDHCKGQSGVFPLSIAIIQGQTEKFNRIFTFFRRINQKNTDLNRSTFGSVHNNKTKKTNKESVFFALLVEN